MAGRDYKRKKTIKRKNSPGEKYYGNRKRYVKRRVEIYGILIIMVSVLLFISVYGFSDAGFVNISINNFLSTSFGIGRFLIPFILLIWGFSFFLRRIRLLPSSFGWGFFLLFFSILGIISNDFKYSNIFDEVLVKARGGVTGAGIYYGLSKLLSGTGAVIVLGVLIVISTLIITKISLIDIVRKSIYLFKRVRMRPRRSLAEGEDTRVEYEALDRKEITEQKIFGKHQKIDTKEAEVMEDIDRILEQIETKNKDTEKIGALGTDHDQLKMPLAKGSGIEDDYRVPPINLLKKSRNLPSKLHKKSVKERIYILNRLFSDFNLDARVDRVVSGPTVTLYELKLSPGVKVQRLLSLEDDFCVAMGSPDLRILTPIPGKSAIGIEVPNSIRRIVTLGDIYLDEDRNLSDNLLNVPIGKNLSGKTIYMNIERMPHILIAGATNSGKSSCLNSIISSLLMKVRPGEARFVMIDPKMVELSIYNGIPHLLSPVIINPKKAASALAWVVEEMEKRFKILVDRNFKSLERYNIEAKRNYNRDEEFKPLPYILVFIDELADLMMVAASEVEDSICRIAQMGRAVGIHLIVSTQRPSVNIITGLIKANIPSRIAFMVSSNVDSRVILDCGGAEKLVGRGDMLYLPYYLNRPERVQGAFVTSKEIEMITGYIRNIGQPEYSFEISKRISDKDKDLLNEDELFYEALRVVVDFGHASASLLQRRLRIGYSRAARIIDQMESRGLVGSYDGSKPREVLISKADLIKLLEESKD
jgi:S-DNA-T family DNA segregation ATPase FtsK/SpoIIIE